MYNESNEEGPSLLSMSRILPLAGRFGGVKCLVFGYISSAKMSFSYFIATYLNHNTTIQHSSRRYRSEPES